MQIKLFIHYINQLKNSIIIRLVFLWLWSTEFSIKINVIQWKEDWKMWMLTIQVLPTTLKTYHESLLNIYLVSKKKNFQQLTQKKQTISVQYFSDHWRQFAGALCIQCSAKQRRQICVILDILYIYIAYCFNDILLTKKTLLVCVVHWRMQSFPLCDKRLRFYFIPFLTDVWPLLIQCSVKTTPCEWISV